MKLPEAQGHQVRLIIGTVITALTGAFVVIFVLDVDLVRMKEFADPLHIGEGH
jgi:hypothetical protein